jgi:tetratricopeptide (TPR) repeat protein
VGAIPIGLVGHHFSSYYVTFAAVGWAVVAGTLLARSPVFVAVVALALSAILNVSANAVNHFRVYPEQQDLRGVSNVNFMRLDTEAHFLERFHAALMAHPPGRGGVIFLSHAPKYMMLATAGERAPKVWFDDPGLSFTYVSHFRPDDRARPSVVLRYDGARRDFVYLPPALVDGMVAGEEALTAGDAMRARRALEGALAAARPGEHDVERIELSNTLGVAANLTGDTLAARQAWQATLALDPTHRGATLNLAGLLASQGHLGAAHDLLTRYIEVQPTDSEILWLLVQVEQAMGRTDDARRLWERISTVDPAFTDSLARAARRN